MKWKEPDDQHDENIEKEDPYYEDDGYDSFSEKGLKQSSVFSDPSESVKKWGLVALAFIVVVAVLILFFKMTSSTGSNKISELEQKIEQLEMKLEKFEDVDEKVTRIWEQAKAFETFKTRFDRSEASVSLRMDHFAMSLDTLQKKTDKTAAELSKLKKAQRSTRASKTTKATKSTVSGKTHTVAPGDTLYNISKKYRLSVDELKALNNLKTGAVIHVGQTLKVGK